MDRKQQTTAHCKEEPAGAEALSSYPGSGVGTPRPEKAQSAGIGVTQRRTAPTGPANKSEAGFSTQGPQDVNPGSYGQSGNEGEDEGEVQAGTGQQHGTRGSRTRRTGYQQQREKNSAELMAKWEKLTTESVQKNLDDSLPGVQSMDDTSTPELVDSYVETGQMAGSPAGMKAPEQQALDSLVGAASDGRRPMDPPAELAIADAAGGSASQGGAAKAELQDGARAGHARLHDTAAVSSANGSPEKVPQNAELARPGLVVLMSDKVVEGAFEHSNGVVTTRANMSELDDSLLEFAAPLIRDVVAAVLGAESARVGLERQTKIYLESGRVGRQWVMRVDSQFAERLGDAATVGYLTRFFGFVTDREIWSPKADSIVAVGGIEARLIAVARALRQAKVGGRQLGSAARLLCTEWQSPIEIPMKIGEGRPPQRKTMADEVVGHVTGDEWDERVLKVRPFGKMAKVPVSYVQAEGEGDQAAIVKEAHGNRTQIYSAMFKVTIVDGKVDHRSLISLTPVQPDLYPNTRDQ